jgi:hypothetical protein
MNPITRRSTFLGTLGLAFAGLVPAAWAGDRKKADAIAASEPDGDALTWPSSGSVRFQDCHIEAIYDAEEVERAIAAGGSLNGAYVRLTRPIRVRAGQRLAMRGCDVKFGGPCAIIMLDPSASVSLNDCNIESGRGGETPLGVIAGMFDGEARRLI